MKSLKCLHFNPALIAYYNCLWSCALFDDILCFFRVDDSKRCQHTASPLGNGAVVETSDKKIIVLKRSDNVGEFPGFYVFPGGHPEVNRHYKSDYFSLCFHCFFTSPAQSLDFSSSKIFLF